MEMLHVLGNTYAAVGSTALLPIYKLNERDIVLIDTGYAKLDRAGLVNLLDGSGLVPKYVLCSHAHFDHTGNVRYLQERYGAKAILSLIEAGISVNPDSYRANYVALTYGRSRAYFLEECFTADVIISADATIAVTTLALALAVTAGLRVTDIVESLLVHPALAEALSDAAE